jgi:hypothetical protein
MFHDHLDNFQKTPLGGRPNTTGRPLHFERSQSLISSNLSCMRTRMNKNSLKYHLVEDRDTYDFTLHLKVYDHMTWFWRCIGTTFGHFFLGVGDSHNFMLTALGLCVKWPWLWRNRQLKLKTLDQSPITMDESIEYTSNLRRKSKRNLHATGCTWK